MWKGIIKIPWNCQSLCLQWTLSIKIEFQWSEKNTMWFILVLLVITLYVLSVCTSSITNLDILRSYYILSHNITLKLVYIKLFLAYVLILYSLKTQETKRFTVFSGDVLYCNACIMYSGDLMYCIFNFP